MHQAGTVSVRRDTEIPGVTKVDTHLEGVVALDKCPVVYDLTLIFTLSQRAVATVDVETGSNFRLEIVARIKGKTDFKSRRSGCEVIPHVDARYFQCVRCKINALIVLGI